MTFIISKNLLLHWNECQAVVISNIYACFNCHTEKKSVHFNCDTLNPVQISIYTLIYAIQRILSFFLPLYVGKRRVSVTIVLCFILRKIAEIFLLFGVCYFLLLFIDTYSYCWKLFCIQYAVLIFLYHLFFFLQTFLYHSIIFCLFCPYCAHG